MKPAIIGLLLALLLMACSDNNETPSAQNSTQQTSATSSILFTSVDGNQAIMFKEIQLSNLFPDSKTFVDSIPHQPMAQIAALYQTQKIQPDFDLEKFVREHFELPHGVAADFKSDINQPVEQHISQLWDLLTRQPDTAVNTNGSLIPLPNAYVVPGGRFREVYYWDSYFTMLGLQVSGRWDLIEGMVNNFSYLVNSRGFIPNGNRTYYEGRSQPPFFALMVELLAQHKGEKIYAQYLPSLVKEYEFWMSGASQLTAAAPAHRRVVRMADGSVLNRYWDDIAAPRPESFKEDYELAEGAGANKAELYRHVRAAAESGWDFSSRWFKNPADMKTIHTTDIVPVDLNALLFNMEKMLAHIYALEGNRAEADKFLRLAGQRQQAVLKYFWNETTGFFHDYDVSTQQQTPVLSLAAIFPLYFGMVDQSMADQVAQKIAQDFLQAGGLTTTLANTGQQWDAPNGWAPLQWLAIQGLRHYQHYDTADQVKSRWVNLNREVYHTTGKLVEKYNVYDIHLPGGGGEYELQDGFGWTNGVLLALLAE